MKKILLILILVCSFGLVGCGQQGIDVGKEYVMLALTTSANGRVTQSFRFCIDGEKVRTLSASLKEELDFKNALVEQVEGLRNQMLFTLALKYIENPIESYGINKGVFLSNVAWSEDCVGFDILFSAGAWQFYNSGTEAGEGPKQGLFLTKIESASEFPFSAKVEDRPIGERYRAMFLNALQGLSFKDKFDYNPSFVYMYSTPVAKIRSNADTKYRTEQGYSHIWVESDLEKGGEIRLWVWQINYGWWIFFALVISLSIMTISIIIARRRERRQAKKSFV